MNARPAEPLRDVIARHGLQATKALGQNFILDRQLLARIAAIPGELDGARVYEVGPGPGGLTRALLDAGANVVAVERDRRCLPALAELEADFPGRLRVIEGDAMALDDRVEAGDGAHIVANLPYNVGTALLLRWLSSEGWPPWWRSLTLMFQREVAERIVAASNSEHYGRLSVAAQWRSSARIAMAVHRSAFVPPPKVTSAVVHIEPAAMPGHVVYLDRPTYVWQCTIRVDHDAVRQPDLELTHETFDTGALECVQHTQFETRARRSLPRNTLTEHASHPSRARSATCRHPSHHGP